MEDSMHIGPTIFCPECAASISLHAIHTKMWVFGNSVICARCKKELDWWKAILNTVTTNFMPPFCLAPIGACSSLFQITIRQNEVTAVDLVELGVPPEARICSINYTAQGSGVIPLECHANSPHRHTIPHKISLYGRPFKAPYAATTVSIMVTWVNHPIDAYPLQNLVEAFHAYSMEKSISAIIPANVAVESKLALVCFKYYLRTSSRKRVEDFLSNGATYSHQLNALLPSIAQNIKVVPLAEHIRGLLNRLRDLRNDLAHRGTIDPMPKKEEIAELLCAAHFGYCYMAVLDSMMDGDGTLTSSWT